MRHTTTAVVGQVAVDGKTNEVRREALCCIPDSVRRNPKERSWARWLTRSRKVRGTRATSISCTVTHSKAADAELHQRLLSALAAHDLGTSQVISTTYTPNRPRIRVDNSCTCETTSSPRSTQTTIKEHRVHIKASEANPTTVGDTTFTDLITSGMGAVLSIARVKVNGIHPPSVSGLSDRAYFILQGSARAHVGDDQFDVGAGDAIYIPKSAVHSITGQVEYVVINVPPFDPKYESSPSDEE
jgi:mannose-6-phosphate isomerase-like protein (cupin superfamily)